MVSTQPPARAKHPAQLPLLRPVQGRLLVGVCRGMSLHLEVSVWKIRAIFIVSTFLFGAGALAYTFLWIFVPVGDPQQLANQMARERAVGDSPLSRGNNTFVNSVPAGGTQNESVDAHDDQHHTYKESVSPDTTTDGYEESHDDSSENLLSAIQRAPKASLLAFAGIIMLLIAVVMLYSGVDSALIIPTMLCLSGIGIAWLRYNAEDGQLLSTAIGIALIFTGYVSYIVSKIFSYMPPIITILSGLVLLLGAGAAVVPWIHSLMRDVGTERALKEREEERADMTAHLHDGVLQTLALIQLHSKDPQTVFSLARQQERELRNWLYQERTPSERSVNAGLQQIAAQVEDDLGKPIEVVTVGDAMPSAQTDALLDATTQALVNAVTHGGEPISVYCEAGEGLVEVFVRDHGDGFDIQHVPANRLGIRESIVGRIKRRGGNVEIVSRAQWGTEVRMHMPVTRVEQHDNANTEDSDQGKAGIRR